LSLYLDTNVVVPMHVDEGTSSLVDHWQSTVAEPFAISDLVAGEFASAMSRLVRMRKLTPSQASVILTRFDQWLKGFEQVEHVGSDVRLAAQLVRQPSPKLLMPDAIHLATCGRTGHVLVTLDDDLAEIANRLGIGCIVPA
jgi:uncharacterized protein